MKAAAAIVIAASVCSIAACSDNGRVVLDAQARQNFDVGECPRVRGSAQRVAIDDLIKNPGLFEGRLVELTGYYYNYFEHSAIYTTPETKPYQHDFKQGIWVTGVPLDYGNGPVKLVGVFTQKIKGHLGQWPGAVCARSIIESGAKRD